MTRGAIRLSALLCSLAVAACADEEPDLGQDTEESQVLDPESEPNGALASATPIVGTTAVISGEIGVGGDTDLYSFTAPAGSRVYLATMTASASGANGNTIIAVLDSAGTLIESDDQDGIFDANASVLAGTNLTAGGTYYVRVTNASAANTTRGYQLHFALRSGTPTLEAAAANDTIATAQPLGPDGGWIDGTTSAAADLDFYSLSLNAGDTIFAALDQDPDRNNTELAGASIAIGPFTALNNLLLANDADTAAEVDAEAHFVTVKTAGTYVVRVAATAANNYHLSVSVHPAAPTGAAAGCKTYTAALPIAVPDVGSATGTLVVPAGDDMIIGDLDVNLLIDGTWVDDLDINLTAPTGDLVGVMAESGPTGAGPHTADTIIDDESAFPAIMFGSSGSGTSTVGVRAQILNGYTVQPNNKYRLSWFDGLHSAGTWTLQGFDDASGDTNVITSWGITVCPAPAPAPVTCAAGQVPVTVASNDFESSDGGFTHSGTNDLWARGTPTAAPIASCNGGTGCWKTNLTGQYGVEGTPSVHDLRTPEMDLTGVVGPIRMQWAQKYQMENVFFDHATVTAQEVGGANPQTLFEFKDATMQDFVGASSATTINESAGWATRYADISSYAGKHFETVFHVDGDDSVNLGGLAIDDFVIVGCEVACGNGDINAGEDCDTGSPTDSAACDFDCSETVCGDGYVNSAAGEACDDPLDPLCDPVTCVLLTCGNGAPDAGEECDPGTVGGFSATCNSNCTLSECGDSIVNPNATVPEQCDVGAVDTATCNAGTCQTAACGDSYTNTVNEDCDTGGGVDSATCNFDCSAVDCGDSYTNTVAGEECDVGATNTAACNAGTCELSECGDGYTNTADGEACDSSGVDTAACNGDSCLLSACGDEYTNAADGEECDVGDEDTDTCNSGTCQTSECGDDYVNTEDGEACDDGAGSPTCTGVCTISSCGDNITNGAAGETCDDGNADSTDNCALCKVARCGDAFVHAGVEMCDTAGASATCDADCTSATCGDNVVNAAAGEQCDQGTTDTATCDNDCTMASCGDGHPNTAADEQCDDGNDSNLDACRNTCTTNECGDGLIGGDEECDDGNAESGDQCNAECGRDTDGDTIGDNQETDDPEGQGAPDTDGDDTADYEDLDSDGDTISDADEAGDDDLDTIAVDTDGDSVPDYQDSDSDDDGIKDIDEAGDDDEDTAPVDSDDDGVPDFQDEDSDDDGVDDTTDNCRVDANEDQEDVNMNGVGDVCEEDTDGDGFAADDNCPDIANPGQDDLDADGQGDACDEDDAEPAGCYDCSGGGNPTSGFVMMALVVGGLVLPRRRRRGPASGSAGQRASA